MRGIELLSVTSPTQSLSSAFEQLAKENIDQLPVIANGNLVGMLRRRDVSRWLELAWKPSAHPMNMKPRRLESSSARPGGGGFPSGDQAHRPI